MSQKRHQSLFGVIYNPLEQNEALIQIQNAARVSVHKTFLQNLVKNENFWVLIPLIDSKYCLNAFNHGIPNWLTKRLYEVIIQIQIILKVPLHVTDKTLTRNVLQN